MVYLRARYYSPITGQFLSRDTWEGVYDKPISLNRFLYTEANPVNNVDPTGFCRLSGWNGPPGTLFSEDTCDRLANIYRDAMGINATGAPSIEDLPVLHQWYSDLADAAERNGYVQGATNLRHFLDGSGTPLQLSAGFMQNDLWGWEYIQDQVNDLAVWFVRKKIHGLTAGCDTEVGPSGYARQINTDYKGLIHDPPAGVAGALGNFRLEVVISGSLNKLHRWSSRTATNLNLHLIVLDFYNWEEDNKAAVLIDGAYHTVPDDWALVLERWGYGKSFFVRGDTDISFTEDVKGQILNLPVSSSPPGVWYSSSCVGINFLEDWYDRGEYPYALDQIGYPFGSCAPGPYTP